MSEENTTCGWVKLYHPAGIDVRLPLPVGQVVKSAEWAGVLESVTNALAAGWLTQAPGLEDGEEKQEVSYVVHKVKNNDDGTDTDVVDLYANHDAMKFSILTVYLNNDDEVKAFERASSMQLEKIPVYVGSDKIERGKSKGSDKFVIKAPRPFFVAHKQNPRWSEEEAKRAAEQHKGYMVPRRKFSSWPGLVIQQQGADMALPSGANEGMVRIELKDLIRQVAELKGTSAASEEEAFCKLGGIASLDKLKPERLDGACAHIRNEMLRLQNEPTAKEIGKLPREVVDGLLKTLAANGHTWTHAREVAPAVIGRYLDNLTLDDVGKLDNWSNRNKPKRG